MPKILISCRFRTAISHYFIFISNSLGVLMNDKDLNQAYTIYGPPYQFIRPTHDTRIGLIKQMEHEVLRKMKTIC